MVGWIDGWIDGLMYLWFAVLFYGWMDARARACMEWMDGWLRQHTMIHHARNYAAFCVLVSGLVSHMVLPELGQAQAAQYETTGPNL